MQLNSLNTTDTTKLFITLFNKNVYLRIQRVLILLLQQFSIKLTFSIEPYKCRVLCQYI